MARRRIKPEVLRPFLLVAAIIIALFAFQFYRPVPPDIRQQQTRSAYEKDLRILNNALQRYQQEQNSLPTGWADLAKINFPFETIVLPHEQPDHPSLQQSPQGPEVRNMPFRLMQQGWVDFGGPPQPLVEFTGAGSTGMAFLYTNGQIRWAGSP